MDAWLTGTQVQQDQAGYAIICWCSSRSTAPCMLAPTAARWARDTRHRLCPACCNRVTTSHAPVFAWCLLQGHAYAVVNVKMVDRFQLVQVRVAGSSCRKLLELPYTLFPPQPLPAQARCV